MLDRLLVNRQYAKLWASGAVSWIGDFVFDTTVLLWIATVLGRGQPWAPAAAGGVLIAVLVPTVVIGPIAGVFVDRWDARRTMLTTDATRAILIGALVILPTLPTGAVPVSAQLTAIYAVVFVNSAVSRFFTPARFAMVADVVEPDQRAKASGIGQGTMALAGIIGPPLAAPLLFTAGIQWSLLVNALSFVISFVAVYSVRVPPQPTEELAREQAGFWPELKAGLRAVLRSKVLMTILIAGIIANFGTYMLNTINVFFVTDNLHTDAKFFGLLDGVLGAGGVLGALIAGTVAQRFGLSRTFSIGLLLTGGLLMVYARSTGFAVALAILLVAAIPLAGLNTVIGPIIMRTVPRELLGRVLALLLPAVQVMSIAGVGVAGWLSASVLSGLDTQVAGVHFGTYDTILLGAGVMITLAGVYAVFTLRGTDKPAPAAESLPADEEAPEKIKQAVPEPA